jgi:peptidoglycan/LPS O-acetylase OafA/YrhL
MVMHRGADETLAREVERATPRTRARQLLRATALLANLALFAAGLYFEAHPRDRSDRWSAAAVAAVAVLNSAALSVPMRGRSESVVRRLRRVALILNTLLLASATLIVALAALRDVGYAAFHGVLLLVPPLVTMLALRRYPPG